MAKKIKKVISWFLVVSILLIGLVVGLKAIVGLDAVVGLNTLIKNIRATIAGTDVTIGGEAPSFTAGPAENPSSHNGAGLGDTAGNPTNEGSDVTFEATADDPNGDNWYLALCRTNSITPGTGGGAPSCAINQELCISGSTTDETQASCAYTTVDGDIESNIWYAFACDATPFGDQSCSSGDQGTGNSGTPFYVNHDPSFSDYVTGAGNPGATAAVTSTAADTDSDAVADTLSLYVCDAQGFTAGGTLTCTGNLLCSSTGQASNPGCNIDIASVKPDGEWTAFGYVVDNHGLASSGAKYDTDEPYTVNNVSPAISAATITLKDTDGTGDLTLTTSGGDTTGFTVVFTVTDANSCVIKGGIAGTNNEIVSAINNVYRSGIGSASCNLTGDYSTDNCYPEANASWNPVCEQDTGTCTDDTDNSVTWTCTFPLGFHSDSTVANTPNSAEDWETAVKATDDDLADSGLVPQGGAQGTEMSTFMAFLLTAGAPINYGSLNAGDDSAEQTTTLKARGNVGIDEDLSGTDMCTDFPTCAENTIAVGQQKYNLSSGLGWTGAGAVALTGTPTEAELNCAKPTHSSSDPTADTYWILRVPEEQTAGVYSGEDTINGITGDDWTL